jgi:hypothetical protein
MPGARRTRSLMCKMNKAHERSHHRSSRIHPTFPHAMVLTLSSVISPVTGFFATVAGKITLTDLTPASGHRTTRLHRPQISALVFGAARIHRIPCPTSVTIAKRPSVWAGMADDVEVIWVECEPEYFCKKGWT